MPRLENSPIAGTMSSPQSPEERHDQAKRVAELVGLLRAFLEGHKDRADIARWTALAARQRSLFPRYGAAHAVFESLLNIEEPFGDSFVVRNQDVAAYLDWLTQGNAFRAASEPLFSIPIPIEALANITGGRDERSWVDGLGWMVTLRFASFATGRCYFAMAPLCHERRLSSIHAHRDDDPVEAARDVIEVFALDESEVEHWHSQLDPAKLPHWTVWRQDDHGGRYEVATYLAYSRAMRECTEMENRGHKQMYWVEKQVLVNRNG